MNNIWAWIVIAIIVIGGGYWLMQGSATPATTGTGVPAQVTNTGVPTIPPTDNLTGTAPDAAASAPMSATINYDGKSFSPSSVTIKQGGTVTFTSTGAMWIASASHPAHTGYDGTDRAAHCAAGYKGAAPFDQCSSGSTFSFTFTKVGTWPFHDHKNSSAYGSVTVVQ